MKPREWWIQVDPKALFNTQESVWIAWATGPKDPYNIHVIEYSAYEELMSYLPKVPTQPYEKELAQKLSIAVEALEYVVDDYCSHCDECAGCGSQHGPIARAALEKLK